MRKSASDNFSACGFCSRVSIRICSMAAADRLCVVTGAFDYTGRHIARMLLESGWRMRTLTNHPRVPDPFAGAVEVRPLNFSRGDELRASLRGADALINTYWVRFAWGDETHARAVAHSKTLIIAARDEGVRRLVHVSITNPSPESICLIFVARVSLKSSSARRESPMRSCGRRSFSVSTTS